MLHAPNAIKVTSPASEEEIFIVVTQKNEKKSQKMWLCGENKELLTVKKKKKSPPGTELEPRCCSTPEQRKRGGCHLAGVIGHTCLESGARRGRRRRRRSVKKRKTTNTHSSSTSGETGSCWHSPHALYSLTPPRIRATCEKKILFRTPQ